MKEGQDPQAEFRSLGLMNKDPLSTVPEDKVEDGLAGENRSGWRATLSWAGAILLWYITLQTFILPLAMKNDPAARDLMLSQVPMRIYQYSEAAFFTAAVLNLISFVFEETPEKRQLALLSALIKGLSWHCDYLIVTGRAVITFDGYGALLLPSRYVQWSCTTPTMIYGLSRMSDFTSQQTAVAVFADWVMILTGYLAAVYPPGLTSCLYLLLSYGTMFIVLWCLYLMIQSALAEAGSPHARTSLHFTLWSSMIIWNLFPVAWLVARMGPVFEAFGEPLLIFCNFSAKIFFSSCILYNNYVTLKQRRMAAQLAEEQRERIRMVAELKSAMQHKDEFISVIGHELRMPLNAIIQLSSAMTANLGAPGTSEKHAIWMGTIHRSATHLLGIINDIITMRAARSGMHIKQDLVLMRGVVDHVVRTLTPMAKPGVVVEKAIADDLPPVVADERRVMQVLSNLLGNALKFTEKGKVSIVVSADKRGRNVIIKIQDTGCGIPAAELGNLLVPFKQADMSSRRKYGGTGLGLSIANQLVEAHSGRLDISSKQGEGTTVVVTLPVLQLETRTSLEAQFREAYISAGYNFDELISHEVAKAEGRRSAGFLDSPSNASHGGAAEDAARRAANRHTSSSFDMGSTVIEQYQWDEQDPANRAHSVFSAAASVEAGPPPMAIALFSALYSSTAVPKASSVDKGMQVKLGVSTPLPAPSPSETKLLQANLSAEPPASSSSQNKLLQANLSDRSSRAPQLGDRDGRQRDSLEGLLLGNNFQGSQGEAAEQVLSLEEQLSRAQALRGKAEVEERLRQVQYTAVSATGCLALGSGFQPQPALQHQLQEQIGHGRADIMQAGQGNRHVGGGYDANRDYYDYDNRMSYECRPSMEIIQPAWQAPSTSVHLPAASQKLPDDTGLRLRPAAPGFQKALTSSFGMTVNSSNAAEAMSKLLGKSTSATDARTSWQSTRKEM